MQEVIKAYLTHPAEVVLTLIPVWRFRQETRAVELFGVLVV
jgi:hypothetical protein